jgi:exodeoxyribonuclease VII large subunit
MVTSRARPAPAPLSVTQLAALVRDALEQELGRVLVAGEISNLRAAASGHLYFTLKDDRSQVRCVMFRSAAQLLPFTPADGQQVVVRGPVSIYPARGDLQLYAEQLEPLGRGALQLALEQLKQRLAAEGLFEEARKRPLPYFPRHIGLATALGGAALHDVLVTLRRRCPALHVVLRPVRVQGVGAAEDIAQGLAELNAHPELEVLIVGRGGGSLEDLWPFNEERVVRAIAASRLPVVSAVGHEIDFTLADLVADRRAATPTAAAELVVPHVAEVTGRVVRGEVALVEALGRRCRRERYQVEGLARRLRDPRRAVVAVRARADVLAERLRAALRRRLDEARDACGVRAHRLAVQHPATRLAASGRAVALARRRLELATTRALDEARGRAARAAGALHGLSPLAVLGRGYSLTRRVGDGVIVRDAGTLGTGDEIEITFAVGRVQARVGAARRPRRAP